MNPRRRTGTRARARTRGAAAVALAVLLILAPAAAGHGGFQVMAKTSGPYSVVVRANPFEYKGVDKIDVTSYVVRQDIGEPDLSARVTLTLDGPGGRRTLQPKVVGDGYQSVLDAPKEAWRDWKVTAQVSGPAGTATVVGDPVGAAPGMPVWLIPGSVLLLLGCGLAMWKLTRSDGPADDDDWTPPTAP